MGSRDKMSEFIQKKSLNPVIEKNAKTGICIERIRELLDEESFVEINSFVHSRGLSFGFDRAKVDGDGVIVGYGTIDDRMVFVASQDPSVYAGSIGQMHAQKISGIIQMTIQANAPFIGIYDTGGARIEEGILALEGLAEVLSSINEASTQIPLFAAIMGPCPGGSAFIASLSHFRFMTAKSSGLYMNGPMVTAATEGKTIDAADIGGSKIHSTKTGLASVVCETENECISSIRTLLNYFPDSPDEIAQDEIELDSLNRVEGRLDEIADTLDNGYQMKEIIHLIVDKNSLFEAKYN